jgi:hypothetical protein
MNQEYIHVSKYEGDGYQPMIDFESWRVAILKYCEELEIQNLKTMQKHDETDEVFVLLEGNCTLFTGGNKDIIDEIDGIVMEPLKLYNVKKGVWHTHTLDKKGMVAIVENQDTCDANSPTLSLTQEQMEQLRNIVD